MKASELIKDIISLAEGKFCVDINHPNDEITVSMWIDNSSEEDNWQVCLGRPSQKQLDCGYVYADLFHTIKTSEMEYRFHCQSDTLLGALQELRGAVAGAFNDWNA